MPTPEGFFDAEPLYRDDEMSIALITLKGTGKHVINHRSLTIYEVVSGSGTVYLDTETNPEPIQAGTVFGVLPDAGYQTSGDLVMLATCKPPFDESTVEILPNNVE